MLDLQCCKCEMVKPEIEFHLCKANRTGRQSQCRPCRKETNKKWYYADLDKTRRSTREANARYRSKNKIKCRESAKASIRIRKEALDELKNSPCVDCGRRFPACSMDFDHRDGTEKKFDVSHAASLSPSRMLAEIAKCDLVCANCHRVRTKLRAQLRRGANESI